MTLDGLLGTRHSPPENFSIPFSPKMKLKREACFIKGNLYESS